MKKLAWAFVSGAMIVMFGMAQLTVPNTFTTGTVISSSAMNANFDLIESEALNRTGGTITGNVAVSNGITVDGRDISTMGEWTEVAYSAGNFTATTGTWGVDALDILTHKYTIVGKTMTVAFYAQQTDVGGPPGVLHMVIPNSATAAGAFRLGTWNSDAGTVIATNVYVGSGGTTISIVPAGGSNWTATTSDNTAVWFVLSFEIV